MESRSSASLSTKLARLRHHKARRNFAEGRYTELSVGSHRKWPSGKRPSMRISPSSLLRKDCGLEGYAQVCKCIYICAASTLTFGVSFRYVDYSLGSL